ncbi:MAG: hypothetical protein AABW50_02205 [Nanoarchaeota archaeon]
MAKLKSNIFPTSIGGNEIIGRANLKISIPMIEQERSCYSCQEGNKPLGKVSKSGKKTVGAILSEAIGN